MTLHHAIQAIPAGHPGGPSAEMMIDALRAERRLVEELVAIMRRQRLAVSGDDLQAVDDSVFATHRVLVTLGEARRRRQTLNRMLGEREDLSLDALDDVLGTRMTSDVRDARDALRAAALLLSQEVAVNRTLLREALANGEQLVRTLAGGTAPAATYGAAGAPAAAGGVAGGTLLNRRI